MRESQIETYLVKRVKALGGEVRKVKWIGRANAPDRLVMLPWACVWVELKAEGEKPTAAQLREHTRMRQYGQWVVVLSSIEEIELFLLQ